MAVKWGILSTADINGRWIEGARATSAAEVVAVGSRDGDRANEFADRWKIERAYGSYEELLADVEVEAVYIPLPNSLHCDWSIRAIEAGKHVLCEKPLGQSAAKVASAFDAAEEHARLLSEAFMYRHNPQTRRLVDLILSGAIGEPRVIRAAFSYPLYDTTNIRLRPEVAGGALMDVGCYCVNIARLIAGEPEVVVGQQSIGPSGTDWVFTGLMRFAEGVIATFDCATTLPVRHELEVVGTEGALFLGDPWNCREPGIEVRRGDATQHIATEVVNSYARETEDLCAAIRGERDPLLGRADAVGQAAAIEALLASVEQQRCVAVTRGPENARLGAGSET